MKTQRMILTILVAMLFSGLTASADPGRIAIAARTGTLGLGGDLMVNILSDLNLRLGIGAFSFSHDDDFSDIDYDFDLDLLTYPITLDWHPFEGDFHISGGIVINKTEVSLDSTYSGSVVINDTRYTAAEVGVLSGDLTFDDIAPYVGIGWGNAFGKDRRWGFVTDLGVAFIGSPDVKLSTTGTLATTGSFLADLAAEEDDLQNDVDDFKIYPVFSANLYFRF